jgi:KEOPS complex subunit Pcc1
MLHKVNMQFQIEFEDPNQANIVMKALKPEISSSPSERAYVELNLKNDDILYVNITASDATSLRAALNSYLRWIILSLDVINIKKLQ